MLVSGVPGWQESLLHVCGGKTRRAAEEDYRRARFQIGVHDCQGFQLFDLPDIVKFKVRIDYCPLCGVKLDDDRG